MIVDDLFDSITNPATGREWTRQELADKTAKINAMRAASAAELEKLRSKIGANVPPAWADPQSSEYVGRREVARRKANVLQKLADPNYRRQPTAARLTMRAPTYTTVPKTAEPVAPAKTTSVANEPPLSKAEYIRRIGAPNLPESVVDKVKTMVESVVSKQDIRLIHKYIDTTLSESCYQEFRRALHEKVTSVSAINRRLAAQKAAQ